MTAHFGAGAHRMQESDGGLRNSPYKMQESDGGLRNSPCKMQESDGGLRNSPYQCSTGQSQPVRVGPLLPEILVGPRSATSHTAEPLANLSGLDSWCTAELVVKLTFAMSARPATKWNMKNLTALRVAHSVLFQDSGRTHIVELSTGPSHSPIRPSVPSTMFG
jgi:hypothetical protein